MARLQDLDVGTFLADDLLAQTDRAGMAHGLEIRVPFLDPVVAELALALPVQARVRGLQTKPLLRAAAAPLLPRGDRPGPQARLLRPGGRVAARAAAAAGARAAGARQDPRAGLVRARRRHRAARPPRRAARGR